jgi:large subunit ribosomal protein L4
MQLDLLNDQGQASSKMDAPETVFGRDYNEALIHQIVVAFQANARQVPAPKKTVSKLSTRPRSLLNKKVLAALVQV